MTILGASHDIRCMFTTPKLLESLALRLESHGHDAFARPASPGIFSGGTEFTPQWNRFAHEELLDGAYMTPTYGNTLMGLAASAPTGPENGYKITYYAPQPRAVHRGRGSSTTRRKLVGYGETGRVKLTTLTKEFFVPGFLERDEGEREPPYENIPGTASAACVRFAGSRRRRRSESTEHAATASPPLGTAVHAASTSTKSSHFATGEPVARVSRANGGLLQRDMRKAAGAREALREIPIDDLIARAARAGELYMNATLPMGDGTQTPDEFVRAQSATTGLPEHMCRANMKKNAFVLGAHARHPDVADARARPSTC